MGLRGHRLLAIVLALSLGAAARGAEEAYPIKVHRAARAGEVFDVHLVFEQTRTETAMPLTTAARGGTAAAPATAGAPATASRPATGAAPAAVVGAVKEQTIKADLTCRVEVVEVNYRGETALWITVGKFISLKDTQELVPAGKVIGLQTDSMDVSMAVRGGGEISEEARVVLKHVHPLEYQLDEVSHGSKSPRKAGETWAVDAVSVSQIDSNVAFRVDAATVKGKVTLVGREQAGTGEGLRMTVEMAYGGQDRLRKTTGEMIERQSLTTRMSLLYPLDAALPPREEEMVADTVATETRRVAGKAEDAAFAVKTHTVEKQTITTAAK